MTLRKPLVIDNNGDVAELPSGDTIDGAGSSSSNVGTGIIDFGTGSNEVSLAVTGQSAILGTSICRAWLAAEATVDHAVADHAYAALFVAITCDLPVAATGFNILAKCAHALTGTFTVHWSWV